MKHAIKYSILLIVILFTNSSLKAQTTADYDKTVDFSKLKTYSFVKWQKDSDKLLNDFDKKRLLDAFKNELQKRGMKSAVSNPDMEISLYLVIDNKTSTTAYTDYHGGFGYGYHRWGGWGMGSSTTTYNEEDYKVGTLVADFFETKTKNQIWQGVLKGTIHERPEKREKTIPKKIKSLMKKYPVPPIKN
jgi:hypothetical protein